MAWRDVIAEAFFLCCLDWVKPFEPPWTLTGTNLSISSHCMKCHLDPSSGFAVRLDVQQSVAEIAPQACGYLLHEKHVFAEGKACRSNPMKAIRMNA